MNNSKLIDVFYSFSNKEIREFGLFVRSPYYNRRQEVIDLFDFLEENNMFSRDFFTKERAWKSVFPNQKYEDSKMRYTMSFLLKVMKLFLVEKEQSSDYAYGQILLCKALRRRGIDRLFKNEMSAAMAWQEKQPHRNAHFHYNNYLLYIEQEEAFTTRTERTKDPLLQKSIDELTHFYISDILRQSCSALSVQAVMQKDYTLSFLKEVLDHVAQNDYSDKPAIMVYYQCYMALNDLKDEVHFYELRALITEHWAEFPDGEIRSIYLFAINCCIKRLNQGNRDFIREGFELYRSGLERKVLLENGVLSKFTYTNAARLGLALKEFDWVEDFLKDYKPYLFKEERENIFTYNLAFFYFQKPDYENAMGLLQKVNFKDVFNNLDVRRMLLRIYFELGEYNALQSLLDSFTVYLNRQKNIGYHKDNYANLIYFVKKILRSNLNDKTQKSKLVTEVEETKAIAEKTWLLEQLQK